MGVPLLAIFQSSSGHGAAVRLRERVPAAAWARSGAADGMFVHKG